MALNNFTQRLLTGIGFISVLLTGIVFSPYLFYFVFALITMLALYEFFSLGKKMKVESMLISNMIVGFSFFTINFLFAANVINAYWFVIFLPVWVMLVVFELYRRTTYPMLNIAYSLAGFFIIVIPFSLFSYLIFPGLIIKETDIFVSLSDLPVNFDNRLVLAFFLLLWSNDTFAYLFGVQFGKHRLFERISPKKSWEGFFGGLMMTIIMSLILSKFFSFYEAPFAILSAVTVSVFGTLGDLVESMFKRSIDVKDSGKLLPGHGGILDRFDGVILASPMIFFVFYIIAKF